MKIIYPILLLFSSLIFGQNSSFVYELKYKPNSDSLKIEKIQFLLDIKGKESLFRSDKFRVSDSLRIKKGRPSGYDMYYNNKQLYVKKNFVTNEVKKYVFVPLIFSIYAINITDKLEWKMIDGVEKVGNFSCQKAEVDYGGRKWTALFTSEINISDGPYIFSGLPGLIVKIYDEKHDYDFELAQIKNFNWKALYPVKIQKEITWENFKKLQTSLYNDPIAMIDKSDIKTFDDKTGIETKTDFKIMREMQQKQIRNNNNPLELNHKVDY